MVKITPALLLASSLIALTGCNDGGGSSSDSGTTTPPPPQAETWKQEVNGETLTFEAGSYVVLQGIEACDLGDLSEFNFDSSYGSETNRVKIAGPDQVTKGFESRVIGPIIPQQAPGFTKKFSGFKASFLAENRDKWLPNTKVTDSNAQVTYTVQLSEAAFAKIAGDLFHYSRVDTGNGWSYVIEPGVCPTP